MSGKDSGSLHTQDTATTSLSQVRGELKEPRRAGHTALLIRELQILWAEQVPYIQQVESESVLDLGDLLYISENWGSQPPFMWVLCLFIVVEIKTESF